MSRASKRTPPEAVKQNIVKFISILQAMKITFINLFRPAITIQYPYVKPPLPERFRGMLHMDEENCIACTLCAEACPVDCIHIDLQGKGKDRKLLKFNIDFNKCMWCALCTEPCPTECIVMTENYESATWDRKNLLVEFTREEIEPTPGLEIVHWKRKPA